MISRRASTLFAAGILAALVLVASPGTARPASTPPIQEFPAPTPWGIAAGPDGNLWFTEGNAHKLGRMTPAGLVTEYALPAAGPLGIAAGPDGNIWFTEADGNKIGRITPTGTITEFAIPTASAYPLGLAAGPDGNLWFTEYSGSANKIARITPAGAITEYALPTGGAFPSAIAAGPDGNLWFTEESGDKIGKITTAGAVTEYPLPTSGASPAGIAAGPDGNLWFTENRGSKIGRITTAGAVTEYPLPAGADPWFIAAGPDGNLWFTEYRRNKIGTITPGGSITEYDVPTADAAPVGITAGLGGYIWFTEDGGDNIGRITVSTASESSSVSTEIHNGAHAVVTTVRTGTTVHDFVTVSGPSGQLAPTGNVNIDWFFNGTCAGNPAANSGSRGPLDANGQFDGDQFAFTVNTAGQRAFRAHYEGNALYAPSDGPCEPLTVVNAAIVIAPSATNEVGQPHTFTATLLFDTGSGLGPAGAGEPVTVTLTAANGACSVPAGPFNLSTNASGQVGVTFTSACAGSLRGDASWTGSVLGSAPLTVETNGVAPNSGPAVKTFVDGRVTVSPAQATNSINTTHTYTASVSVNAGSGAGYVPAPDGTLVTFTLLPGSVGSFVGGNTCQTSGGSCTVRTTSAIAGSDEARASATVVVGGVQLSRTSDTALKTWTVPPVQRAAMVIAPNATNEVGQSHTFTATLIFDRGSGFVPTGAGEPVTVTLTAANGACPVPAGPLNLSTNANGQVSVTFTSACPGSVTGHASWSGSPSGSPLVAETNGVAPNSGPAVKTFVDARVAVSPAQATNSINTMHTYTASVSVNDGSGAYVPAPNGTLVTFTLLPGSVGSFVGGNTCLTSGGSCTVQTTSAIAGSDEARASATVAVGGVQLTRTSNAGLNSWTSPNADLRIQKSASPTPVLSGTQLTYTITVTNNGPLNATGVTMTDQLPSDIKFRSMSTTRGTCLRTTVRSNDPKDGLITCNVGSLAAGTSATVMIVVLTSKLGLLSNMACVNGNEADLIPGNNCATAKTSVVGP